MPRSYTRNSKLRLALGSPGARGVGYAINGMRAASTDMPLDGCENVDLFSATVGQTVPLDSVQCFNFSHFPTDSRTAFGATFRI